MMTGPRSIILVGYAALVAMLPVGCIIGWMVCRPDVPASARIASALTSVFIGVFLTYSPVSIALAVITRRNWLQLGIAARIFGLLPAVVTAVMVAHFAIVVGSVIAMSW
jgi:hypothetical protein